MLSCPHFVDYPYKIKKKAVRFINELDYFFKCYFLLKTKRYIDFLFIFSQIQSFN